MLLANLLLRGAQIDLTADKLYTISDGTEHIVESLKEPVNLYLFFSGTHRDADSADQATTASACASCSKNWCRAPTASSRSR